jgi:hypothetical protein
MLKKSGHHMESPLVRSAVLKQGNETKYPPLSPVFPELGLFFVDYAQYWRLKFPYILEIF